MKIFTMVEVVVAVLALILVGYAESPAPAERVQSLIQQSNRSPEARALVSRSLLNEPSPSVGEYYQLKRDVNELLVRDIARDATGTPSLTSRSEREAEDERRVAEARRDLNSKSVTSMSAEELLTWLTAQVPVLLTFGLISIVLSVVVRWWRNSNC